MTVCETMNPVLALILANSIWGAGPPIFKLALTNIPPFTLAFIRFFLAAIIFLPIALRQPLRALNFKDWAAIVVGSFFGVTVNIGAYFLGLERAESINASVIASSAPVFVFFLSILFLHEKARLRTSLGMVVALVGVLLLVLEPLLFSSSTGAANSLLAWQGNMFYIIAMIGSVFFPIILKHVLNKVSIYVVLCFGFLFSALTFFPFMLKELATWSPAQINAGGLFGILYGVFGCSALAYALYFYGLSKITAQEAGVFTYIDPAVTVLVAIPLLHEYPSTVYFASLFLILLGVYISEGRLHYHPILWFRRHTNRTKIVSKEQLIREP